jgi:hypothetical protein
MTPIGLGRRATRSLGFQVFASESHAPRARRAVDAAVAFVGAALVVALAAVADDNSGLEQSWSRLAESLPGWLQWLAGVTYFLGAVYLGILIVGVGLIARQRKDVLRDILAAGVLSIVVVIALARIVSGTWPEIVLFDLSGTAVTYPAMFITILTAVAVTASPHLSRPLRRTGRWVVLAAALAALLANLTEVRDTVAALIAGVAIGALVHLSSVRRPDALRWAGSRAR